MTKDNTWKCNKCGTINKSYYLNCMTCQSYKNAHAAHKKSSIHVKPTF